MKKQEQTVEAASLTFLQKLHKAKQSIKKVAKNAKNPHFKNNYADINALIDEVEPVLLENNLLLLQPIEDGYVFSRIIDIDSGEIRDIEPDQISLKDMPDLPEGTRLDSVEVVVRVRKQ